MNTTLMSLTCVCSRVLSSALVPGVVEICPITGSPFRNLRDALSTLSCSAAV